MSQAEPSGSPGAPAAGVPAPEAAPEARRRRAAAVGVALATLALMLATEPRLAIVWDEGFTLMRLARVRAWFHALRDPQAAARTWRPEQVGADLEDEVRPPSAGEIGTRRGLLSRHALAWFWPFAREEPHGHPPFYAIVALAGDVLTPWRDELGRARLGSMLAFAATAGALFAFEARRRGPWSAAVAAGAFALQPPLFALGHYAHYDALLTCLWVGAIMAFAEAVIPADGGRPRPGWAVLFGVLAGCAAGTKLTGWLLPLPLAAWAARERDRRALVVLAVGGAVAAATLLATTPPWWNAPAEGLAAFFRSNLTRGETTPLPVLFLGRVYVTPNESLPWYNTLLWTAIATPVGFLGLGAAGVALSLGRGDRLGRLVVANYAFLLLLRALPHTPGHDGVRQFLPAFGCLAMLAGRGAGWAAGRLGAWGRGAAVLALAEGAVSVGLMMPVPLSYYSPVVGGLPGAARLGMEPTYYWDALTDETLAWINAHTAPGRTVLFSSLPASYFYLTRSGRLRPPDFGQEPAGDWQWYLLQNRPGAFGERDRRLVTLIGPRHVIAAKWGVPLVWAFPARAARAAAAPGTNVPKKF